LNRMSSRPACRLFSCILIRRYSRISFCPSIIQDLTCSVRSRHIGPPFFIQSSLRCFHCIAIPSIMSSPHQLGQTAISCTRTHVHVSFRSSSLFPHVLRYESMHYNGPVHVYVYSFAVAGGGCIFFYHGHLFRLRSTSWYLFVARP